jgi:hypothetical protein
MFDEKPTLDAPGESTGFFTSCRISPCYRNWANRGTFEAPCSPDKSGQEMRSPLKLKRLRVLFIKMR